MTAQQILRDPPPLDLPVRLTGTVLKFPTAQLKSFILRDETGAISVRGFSPAGAAVRSGDRVRVTGTVGHSARGLSCLNDDAVETIGHEPPLKTVAANPEDIIRGAYDYRPVVVDGVITDVFSDDVDRNYTWLLIEKSGVKLPVAVPTDANERARIMQLVDATVSVTGISTPDLEHRRFLGFHINQSYMDAIHVIEPPPADPFTCEEFKHTPYDQIEHMRPFAHRRRIFGRVLATWRSDHLFVRLDNDQTVRVRLAATQPLPPVDASVTVVGFLRKDAFYARLENAIVRIDRTAAVLPDRPRDISPLTSFPQDGAVEIDSRLNGKVIRMRGQVLNVYQPGTPLGRIDMKSGDSTVPVEIGIHPPPAVNSTVEVSGVCVIETATEDAGSRFARLRGFSIVPRRASDIRVITAPPWWSPARLLAVIGSLLLVIGMILFWNISLKRLSNRKSRALLNEQQAHLVARLRIDERTRLAVELHDSLAQNLTGISLQLDAAELARDDRDTALAHLANAREALRSCREGLRYCLSDLRSRSFEDTDMTEAIVETVQPHVGKARLSVRFTAPRASLSDSSAHAVLCIIRELAVNAVRHGHATSIRVAGEYANNTIRFSVQDNGCGFNPSSRPGPAQGHFGLLGVSERVKHLSGSLQIASCATTGTKITISFITPPSTAAKGVLS